LIVGLKVGGLVKNSRGCLNTYHQYDDEAEEMSQAINNILHQKSIIISIYQKVKDKYQLS